jgi:hypothetical protein
MATINRQKIPAERLHPKAAYSRCRPKGAGGPFPIGRPVRTRKRSLEKQGLKAGPGDSGHSRVANADPDKSKANGCISWSRTGSADPEQKLSELRSGRSTLRFSGGAQRCPLQPVVEPLLAPVHRQRREITDGGNSPGRHLPDGASPDSGNRHFLWCLSVRHTAFGGHHGVPFSSLECSVHPPVQSFPSPIDRRLRSPLVREHQGA